MQIIDVLMRRLFVSECSFPSTPNNGEVAVSDAAGVSVATYKCLNGFTLSGPSSRQCHTEGAGWQGSDPTCGMSDLHRRHK